MDTVAVFIGNRLCNWVGNCAVPVKIALDNIYAGSFVCKAKNIGRWFYYKEHHQCHFTGQQYIRCFWCGRQTCGLFRLFCQGGVEGHYRRHNGRNHSTAYGQGNGPAYIKPNHMYKNRYYKQDKCKKNKKHNNSPVFCFVYYIITYPSRCGITPAVTGIIAISHTKGKSTPRGAFSIV